MRSIIVIATAMLLLLALPAASRAQEHPDSILRRNDCRLAEQILTQGEPANKRGWAFWRITVCGTSGAEVLAPLINAHRDDEEFSAALDSLITAGRRLIEPVLFETALDMASDGSPGRSARVQAIRLLYAMLTPGNLASYETFLADGGQISTSGNFHMAPLPSPMDALERAEAILTRIIAAENTPEDVHAASDKVRRTIWVELECPLEVSMDECLERLAARRERTPKRGSGGFH
jgi:hypothetical protein